MNLKILLLLTLRENRSKKSSTAEIDYIITKNNHIYPIEVKSGPAGKLKSLHIFLKEYPKCEIGIVLTSARHPEFRYDNLLFLPLYTLFD